MKKQIIALMLALLLCLAGCQSANDPQQEQPQENQQEQQEQPEENQQQPEENQQPDDGKGLFTADTLPRIDGSTATIPLSEGLVKHLLDYTPEQAQDFVHHNTTHFAYENLIAGDCDIIFVTPPSVDELQLMADSGEEFEVVKVVKDAFVFLVNADNPVESVSLSDLQDIYRGNITNWSEVGGDDVDIIAYQRQDNSGSQTLLYKLFLSKDELMPPPTELVIAGMGELVDAVSEYDGGQGALGYSVFYYAGDMYTSDGSRLLAVDGVLPTVETVADDSYPLIDGYYAVFRKSEPEDGAVRKLLSFLLSQPGQRIAQAEGYVPLQK